MKYHYLEVWQLAEKLYSVHSDYQEFQLDCWNDLDEETKCYWMHMATFVDKLIANQRI